MYPRIIYSTFLILSLSLSYSPCFSQAEPILLKVLSYNIHYGVGMDAQKDLNRIAAVINRLDPDLVGLQEVADSAMVATLAQLTQMSGVFGASTEKEPPNLYRLLDIPVPVAQLHYGDGILSKHPFQYSGNLSIPSASSSRYQAMCVEVDVSKRYGAGKKIRFITTHFDWLQTIGSQIARKAAVEVIEEAFMLDPVPLPTLLTGDLNATPESEVLQLLEQKGWRQENFEKDLFTVPTRSPSKQIDYVLVRPQSAWRIVKVEVIEEDMASDHLPILMTVELIVN